MIHDHDRYVQWAAAYTLGALDSEDRSAFEDHLATCGLCAAELAELAPVPGLIAKTDPGDIEHHPDRGRAVAIAAAARQELRALQRRSRRWQLIAAGLGAAAAAVVALLIVDIGDSGTESPPTQPATVAMTTAASTEVAVSPRGWGTEITLDLTGLPTRNSYRLWAVDIDGHWTTAATWSPTSTGVVRLTGATGTPTEEIARIVITSDRRDDVLVDTTL